MRAKSAAALFLLAIGAVLVWAYLSLHPDPEPKWQREMDSSSPGPLR